jgi:hypothetical protein
MTAPVSFREFFSLAPRAPPQRMRAP